MALDSLNKITLDVSTPLNTPVVRAVQEDIRSRYVEITLVSNGEPLVLPAGVTAIVGLRRANDTYVLYDTDEDNNPAVTFAGNKATVYLRQEAVAMAGSMYTTVTLFNGTNKKLSAFAFTLKVDQTAVPSDVIVESDYINIFQHELDEINTLLNNLSATATTLPAGSDATASYSDGVFSFGIPKGETGDVSEEEFEAGMESKAPVIVDTASGEIASIVDGADGMDARSLVVNIEPIQAGSGDPSPDNIRPITGRTGLTVTRTEKNVFGGQPFADAVLASCTSAATQSGNIVTLPNGASNVQADSADRAKMFENKFQTGSYTIIIGQSDTEASLATRSLITAFYTDGTYVAIVAQHYDATKKLWRWVSAPTKTLAFLRMNRDDGNRQEYDISRCGIFRGDVSVADFAPYAGTTYPITWQSEAGTVYGGTLDVVSGVLTITDRLYTFSGSDSENWTLAATGTNRIFRFNNAFIPFIDRASHIPYIANWATPTTIINNVENCGSESWLFRTTDIGTGNQNLLVVTPTSNVDMSLDGFKAMLTANPLTICAKLYDATQTYQLTPTEVEMLLGVNNIFSDGGSVSVEYPCDTKLFIEKLTKPTEDDMVANANIPIHKFFMIGNSLYYSTAAIAQGAAIIVGTNCVRLSLAEALNQLNS